MPLHQHPPCLGSPIKAPGGACIPRPLFLVDTCCCVLSCASNPHRSVAPSSIDAHLWDDITITAALLFAHRPIRYSACPGTAPTPSQPLANLDCGYSIYGYISSWIDPVSISLAHSLLYYNSIIRGTKEEDFSHGNKQRQGTGSTRERRLEVPAVFREETLLQAREPRFGKGS